MKENLQLQIKFSLIKNIKIIIYVNSQNNELIQTCWNFYIDA